MNRKQRRTAFAKGKRGMAYPAAAHQSYVLGHACHSKGDFEGAKAHYLRAATGAPNHPGVLLGLGLIALQNNLLDDAEDLLRRAAKADPADANIMANLAAVLLTRKKFADCVTVCKKAIELQPGNVEALVNLSQAYLGLGDHVAAVDAAKGAVAKAPNSDLAHKTLSAATLNRPINTADELESAISAISEARASAVSDGSMDTILADLLIDRGRAAEAVDLLASASADRLDDPRYVRLTARSYFEVQNYEGALYFAKKHCELEPDSLDAHAQIAKIYANLNQPEDALKSLQRCLEINPTDWRYNLDICILRQSKCDWDGLEELQNKTIDYMRETKLISGPFHLLSMAEPAGSPENQLLSAQIYQNFSSLTGVAPNNRHHRRRTNDKLRIGYLSNDYRDHATAFLLSELIELHDRAKFEIVGYCYSRTDNTPFQHRLRAAFDKFVDINAMSLEEAAKQIDDDGIDILVDLKGFTQGSRTKILHHRPAPIQVNYLGFPGTLGTEFADYIIGDEFLTPLASAPYYSEKIVQLPNCYQPNDSKRTTADFFVKRQDFGLPETGFVFCSFNNPNKLTRPVFEIWMRLLKQVPGSVFWIYALLPSAKANLRKEAERCGVDPDRLVFAGFADIDEHIARMRMGDLFLDAFPCTAHTTASEAIWAGLPLVTCAGRTFASRVAGSILRNAEMPDLVTETLDDYEALALALAKDPDRLAAIRKRVQRSAKTPLFDIATYTRDLERAYEHMAEIYNRGDAPEAFAVKDLNPQDPFPPTLAKDAPAMQANAAAPIVIDFGFGQTEQSLRIAYECCPLCHQNETLQIGSSDCTGHSLYKSNLPGTIDWNLCRSCKHVFASGFFGEEGMSLLHPTTPLAERAAHDIERKRQPASKVVQRVARIAKAGTWLDVGFGDASLLFAAEEWGYHPVGLDIRADNVKALQDLGYEAHEKCIEIHEGEGTCSVVSMVNLLQHVPFPGSAVENAARLLKPGGVAFIVTPNMDTMLWRMMDRDRQNPFWKDIEIYHHFTRQRMYDLLLQNGLVPVEYNVSERHRASMEIMAIKPSEAT